MGRKVTMVNGSSIPELEPEKKSPLEPEYGKRSKNIRTLEDGLIIEDLSAGNSDAEFSSDGKKVTPSFRCRVFIQFMKAIFVHLYLMYSANLSFPINKKIRKKYNMTNAHGL